MRANALLHERHLLEAIRRGVITQDQAESLLALARTEPGGAARMPDVAWLGLAQGAVVALAAIAAVAGNMDHPWRTSPMEELGRAAVVSVALFALGFGLRKRRALEVPASVALAGAGLQFLALGHAFVRRPFDYGGDAHMGVAFAVLTLVSLAVWRFLRAGPALAAASFGLAGCALAVMRHGNLFEREVLPLAAVGVGLLGWSAWRDRAATQPPVDGAFWTHLAGCFSLAVSGAVFVDREPGGFFPFAALALIVGWTGLRLRRRVLLASAGVSLLFLPPFALSEARMGDEAVALGFFASAAAVSAMAHLVRRALLDRAATEPEAEPRSVWL
jgi:hypothetical protein